jgi:hypothetical protein
MTIPLAALLCLLALRRSPWLISVWVFFYIANPTLRFMVGQIPVYWSDVVSGMVLSAFLTWKSGEERKTTETSWWGAGLIVAMFAGVLSTALRYGDIVRPSYELLRHGLALSPMFLLPRMWHSSAMIRAAAIGAGLAGVTLFLVAVGQTVSKETAAWIENLYYGDFNLAHIGAYSSHRERIIFVVERLRAYGMYSTATMFGGVSVLVGMIIMNLNRGDLSPFLKKCLWVTIAASAVAAMLSYSRHALLAMLMAGILYFLMAKRGKMKALLFGMVILLGGLQIVSVDFWQERVGKGGVTTDSNLRARLIDRPQELVERIAQDPLVLVLGAGLGLKRLEDLDHKEKREAQFGFASNGFLLYLFNTGMAAFSLVLALYGRALVCAFKLPDDRRAVAIAGVLCAASVVASDNYAFVIPNIPFMTSLILASVIGRSGRPGLQQPYAPQRIRGGFSAPAPGRSVFPDNRMSLP